MKALYLTGVACFFMAACGAPGNDPSEDAAEISPQAILSAQNAAQYFDRDSLAADPKIVDCTLSGGATAKCLSITLKPAPESFTIGPWCPRNISDGPDVSGIWLEGGKVYDADGAFIQNMSTFYDDSDWQMFDPATGKINITDSKISCAAAARPDVDPQYQNHCVECQISYLDEGLSPTYVIPLHPVPALNIAPRVDHGGVGVAFSGARLDASAPTDAILAAHTVAPFDDCGGHVNLNAGYHIHAVMDCLTEVPGAGGHGSQIGLAMDGYGLFARYLSGGVEPTDLDQCRGHEVDGIGYHYHVNAPGENAIIGCHSGQTGCTLEDSGAVCDSSQVQGRPPRGNVPPPGRDNR
ncbi:YHYH protein [Robiginitomaculum antarcticum]|uniref:YHYH protein n=1 Tax=Robiginitomaculum antarcticum TaxID=437507 RepID=UPI00036D4185|nr:YHYH protein [Robiginitomaculum antarcticum]